MSRAGLLIFLPVAAHERGNVLWTTVLSRVIKLVLSKSCLVIDISICPEPILWRLAVEICGKTRAHNSLPAARPPA